MVPLILPPVALLSLASLDHSHSSTCIDALVERLLKKDERKKEKASSMMMRRGAHFELGFE